MPEREAHSLIGASSCERWLNCPGSVRLYSTIVRKAVTDYASAGTAAHELCEKCLTSGKDPEAFFGEVITADGKEFTVDEEMVASTSVYVTKVRNDYLTHGGVLNVEKSFDLGWLYPGMFGRNDASIIPDKVFGVARIYDYKNGRKPVRAKDNPQLMYYALGALGKENKLFAEKTVCTIVQPNCWCKNPVDEWETWTSEIYEWGHDVLLPAAKKTKDPDAPMKSGDWCTFCEAAGVCPLRQQEALTALAVASAPATPVIPPVETMTPEMVGRAVKFFTSDKFTAWVKSLVATELALLQHGVAVPGRKLVEHEVLSRNRRWGDEAEVVKAFKSLCGEELFDTKLKSPAQLEKLLSSLKVGKKEREEMIAPLVVRDRTTKTLVVSEDDERRAVEERQAKAIEMFN